jgi:beta-glucosidase
MTSSLARISNASPRVAVALLYALPVLSVLSMAAMPLRAAAAEAAPVYLDASRSDAERAADLVGRLSLAEKIAQLQDGAPAVERLGLPAYGWWNEGLHGLARNGVATVFPQAIGLAASWDAPLLQAVGGVIAGEARAKAAPPQPGASRDTARYTGLTIWSPNINLFRDPRWGRGQETYGEDPVLTARLGVAFVQGLQGPDEKHPQVIATPKHFAVHSGPERDRHQFNVNPSAHDLEDSYLPAFRATITEAKAGSIMCAYNALDGAPACANADLLQQRLRQDWGFRGFVVTDCDAVEDMTAFHKITPNDAEASARALQAGTDLNCGKSYAALSSAVASGRVSEAEVDRALQRLFEARLRLGLFAPAASQPARPAASPPADGRALALRAARESMVLLKNNGVLPLAARTRVAVLGPTAELLENLLANYHGTARDPITPLAGMRAALGSARVLTAQGASLAENLPVAVPQNALRTPQGQAGLRREVFANAGLQGRPVAVSVDANLNLDFNRAPPAAGLPARGYSVRWQGQLRPPAAGDYQLGMRVDRCFDCAGHDRVRLYLDDQLIQDGDSDQPAAVLHFADKRPHALRVEWLHTGEDQGLALQWQAPAQVQLNEAVAVAKQADVLVAFVGLSPNLEGEQLQIEVPGFDGGDRSSLDLPAAQERLLQALKATGKPLVVVLQSGSAVALRWAAEHADAVLAAWYPGEVGGQAIAETLLGRNNPAGRLPVTFYRSADDLPPFADYGMQGRSYRYFNGTSLWPFGHGLSYSRFSYGAPQLSAARLTAAHLTGGQALQLDVEVENTSTRDGDEVVQVYLEVAVPRAGDPRHALIGFQRVPLKAGERRRVQFQLDARALSRVDAQGVRSVEPGHYRLAVGGGQPGDAEVLRTDFEIEGRQVLPR